MSIPRYITAALGCGLAAFAGNLFGIEAAFAQDAVAEVAPIIEKGDVAWMMTATALVLFMTLPGLALFYGGLVRAKNMLSVLMQCTTIAALAMVIWVTYGYSFAFGGSESAFFGGFAKVFLSGVSMETTASTFTDGVVLPEYVFICFQMTFAVITPALIVGAFAERIKFSAVVLFTVLWLTLVYFPVAHMVWDGNGYLFNMGALDFAGGTVVHINAGVAALVGSFMVGKRIGYGKEILAPHSMTLTMVGASILWIGWFGFNAGSAAAADASAALAMLNTLVATAAGVIAWTAVEAIIKRKPSALGAATGAIAGLVGVTPAAGSVGPLGAIVIGLVCGAACVWAVTGLKRLLDVDDSLDVFGVHGVAGIIGAVLTGVFSAQSLGGTEADLAIGAQVGVQIVSVLFTVVWCAPVTAIAMLAAKFSVGLRVSEESERVGLDITSHGESAYE